MSSTFQKILGRRSVHPFPARMAPSIVSSTIATLPAGSRVLDPMVGSGTVLALARAFGHRGVGFDVDPLAVLIARVWTTSIQPRFIKDIGRDVLAEARELFKCLKTRDAYPSGADFETRRFVRYWFDPYTRRQLAALSRAIAGCGTPALEVLWCAFSRLIISKQAGASRALDLAHSRPHRWFTVAPRKPFRYFEAALDQVIQGCVSAKKQSRGPATRISLGDVRQLPIEDGTIDLVLTSPPYLNAIDYLRCSKFSLVWMGHLISELRTIRKHSLGTEAAGALKFDEDELRRDLRLTSHLSQRTVRMLGRYAIDTHSSLREVTRVVRARGRIVYVVGENTIRGVFIPTGRLVTKLATRLGLSLESRRVRKISDKQRYLPPPASGRNRINSRMRREVILTFLKSPRK